MYKYQSKTDISKTSDEIISFLEGHLHTLKTPSVYLGREINTISKPWDEKKTRIILYMPVEYQAGVNNLGTAILYNRLNAKDDVICERGYLPENALRKKLVSKRYPTGFSLESKHQLKDFDCIGFSCYFELQFLNLIYMLYHSGVPLYSKERDNDNYPIVILGGVAAYSPAVVEDIVDMVFIGEGEEQMDLLAKKLADYKTGKYVDKRAFLLDCAITIPGCYVPQFYTVDYSDNGRGRWITSITPNAQLKGLSYPIIKACFDISSSTPFYKRILPKTNGLHIGYNGIEIARGCYNSCRFCMASAIYKPYREYSIDKIITAIDDAINYFGCNEITPHSLNYSSYSERYRLIKKMSEKLRYISSASQRLDTFSPILAESLHDRGSKRATFAIEAGSQRMRDVVNKEITDQNIHDTLTTLIDLKYSSVKLYMISGLPFETPTDTLKIINILNPIVEHAKRRRTRFTIKLSYTQFTAKPFTALQWVDVTEVLDPQPNTG